MPVSQSRLLICLFASSLLSTTGLADSVIVTTTVDENNVDNPSCSLREAVSYLNAKITKKSVIDEDIAVISGTSATLRNQLFKAKLELATELTKASPDATKVSQLQNTISQLNAKIDAGLLSLNAQLNTAKANLELEKAKPTQNATLIANYEAQIIQLEKDIKTKDEEKAAKEKDLKDYRAKGLFGCSSVDDSSAEVIALLLSPTPYLVNAPLTINLNITINGVGVITARSDGTAYALEDSTSTLPFRPILKANSTNSLFIIDNGISNTAITTNATTNVTFNDIDFIGCEQNCTNKGGIFLNKENLTINNSVIHKGNANYGGAIYNQANATLIINDAVFRANEAIDGAAIFAEENNVLIKKSLFTQGKAPNNGIITINTASTAKTTSIIENSTLSGNEGAAISGGKDVLISNTTIVNNTIGIRLNNNTPLIYNNIIAGNSQADCDMFATIPSDGKVYFANNLSTVSKGCPIGASNHNNIVITNTGNETLFAALDSNNRCVAPPAIGLLCPLAENGGLTKTHKPRLLANYTQLSESPIVNKGFYDIVANQGLICSSTDQRGFARENSENRCDIGAVEIQTGLKAYKQGDDIVFGQIKRFNISENIFDAELFPASLCSNLLGAGEYRDGCARLVDLPKHGVASFDAQTGEILYSTTNPSFHGFDTFSYNIVTTLSRFSDAANDKTLRTDVRVVSEPPASLASKTLDSGATGIFSLLMLSSLLVLWRRTR